MILQKESWVSPQTKCFNQPNLSLIITTLFLTKIQKTTDIPAKPWESLLKWVSERKSSYVIPEELLIQHHQLHQQLPEPQEKLNWKWIYIRPIYFRLDFKWHKIGPYWNHSPPLSAKEKEIISQEIKKWIKKKVVLKSYSAMGALLSGAFTKKKTYGNKRMILNLKIKMLSINNIINLLKPNWNQFSYWINRFQRCFLYMYA